MSTRSGQFLRRYNFVGTIKNLNMSLCPSLRQIWNNFLGSLRASFFISPTWQPRQYGQTSCFVFERVRPNSHTTPTSALAIPEQNISHSQCMDIAVIHLAENDQIWFCGDPWDVIKNAFCVVHRILTSMVIHGFCNNLSVI